MADLIESSALSPASLTGKTWAVKIIEGDRQGSSAYYPKEALEEGAHLFAKGTRIYLNHPTADASKNLPERSAKDIIGVLESDAQFDGKDLLGSATIFSDWQGWVKERAEAGVVALSIRASGVVTESNGTPTLSKFTKVHSVDLVTVGGAGGEFRTILESDRTNNEKEVPMATLEEGLDALVADSKANATVLSGILEAFKAFTKDSKKEDDKEKPEDGKPDAEDKAEGEDGKGNKLPKKKVKESFAEIDAALTEAKLPAVSRSSVFAAVEAGADLKESVDAEVAKVKAILTESGAGFGGFVSDEGKQLSEAETLKQASANIFG